MSVRGLVAEIRRRAKLGHWCAWCGRDLKTRDTYVSGLGRRFCSEAHYTTWLTEHYRKDQAQHAAKHGAAKADREAENRWDDESPNPR